MSDFDITICIVCMTVKNDRIPHYAGFQLCWNIEAQPPVTNIRVLCNTDGLKYEIALEIASHMRRQKY